MIKGIIFDFDGLIVDTETLWYEVFKEIMEEYQVKLPLEEFAKVIGTTDKVLNEYFEAQSGMSIIEANLHTKKYDLYHQKAGHLELREGVLHYLEEARKLQLKIGLASSSGRDWVESYLRKFNIYDYFEVIKTKEDVEQVKPDPSLYIKAMEDLKMIPEETIAFEDSLNGSKAAISAGIKCVIVPNPVTAQLAFENYHLRLSSMAEKSLSQVINEVNTISPQIGFGKKIKNVNPDA